MTNKRYYRYGVAADKKIFEANPDALDGLVIPAHLACDQKSLSAFLGKMKKPYFVDPMTFAFSLAGTELTSESGELKRSYKKLRDAIKWPSAINFENGARLPASYLFDAEKAAAGASDAFVKSILDLQSTLSRDPEVDKLLKLMQDSGEDIGDAASAIDKDNEPAFKLPPYFYFESYADPWLATTVDAFERAKRLETDAPVYAVVMTSPSFLQAGEFGQLLELLPNADGFVIWIDDFWEISQPSSTLIQLRRLVKTLSAGGERPIVSLYGGMFQSFLATDGLTAFASGLGYSDSKARVTASGGLPAPRYFVPGLFQNLVREELGPYLQGAGNVECGCSVCKSMKTKVNTSMSGWQEAFLNAGYFPKPTPGKRSYADGDNQARLKTHFLLSFSSETKKYDGLLPAQIATDLRARYEAVKGQNPVFAKVRASHLLKWADALSASVS